MQWLDRWQQNGEDKGSVGTTGPEGLCGHQGGVRGLEGKAVVEEGTQRPGGMSWMIGRTCSLSR